MAVDGNSGSNHSSIKRRQDQIRSDVLRKYLDEIDANADAKVANEESDEEEEEFEDVQNNQETEEPTADQDEEEEEDEDQQSVVEDTTEMESEFLTRQASTIHSYKEIVPMEDAQTWTHEPELDRYLYVRVFTPQGLDCREIKCVLTYREQFYKTSVLDPLIEDDVAESEETEIPVNKPRGLIGTRGSAGDTNLLKSTPSPDKITPPRYEQCVFDLPMNKEIGKNESVYTQQQLKIAVHYGPKEKIVGMATIEMEDLMSLDLPTLCMPAPPGDAWPPAAEQHNQRKGDMPASPSLLRYDESDINGSPDVHLINLVKEFTQDLQPVSFPVYSIQLGRGDTEDAIVGSIPLVVFWATKPKPFSQNRLCETDSMRDVVLEMLGVDMYDVTKEDLEQEKVEREEREERMQTELMNQEELLRKQFEEVMTNKLLEMEELKIDYENQIHELSSEIQQLYISQAEKDSELQHVLQAQQNNNELLSLSRPRSRQLSPIDRTRTPLDRTRSPLERTRSPISPKLMALTPTSPDVYSIHQPQEDERIDLSSNYSTELENIHIEVPRRKLLPAPEKIGKNFRIGRQLPDWGADLPKDFLERQELFEGEMKQRRQELIENLSEEIARKVEKKLASEFKLSRTGSNNQVDTSQDVSLPAVFLPHKSNNMMIFNPRAHQYFHPPGSNGTRLTQPPSMLTLPPLPKNKISVVNLFELGTGIEERAQEWLLKRYLEPRTPNASRNEPQTPHASFVTNPVADTSADHRVHSVPEMLQEVPEVLTPEPSKIRENEGTQR